MWSAILSLAPFDFVLEELCTLFKLLHVLVRFSLFLIGLGLRLDQVHVVGELESFLGKFSDLVQVLIWLEGPFVD